MPEKLRVGTASGISAPARLAEKQRPRQAGAFDAFSKASLT
jgi:hypothetical protein